MSLRARMRALAGRNAEDAQKKASEAEVSRKAFQNAVGYVCHEVCVAALPERLPACLPAVLMLLPLLLLPAALSTAAHFACRA